MDFQLPPVAGVNRVAPTARTQQPSKTYAPQAPSSAPAVNLDTIPASPPPEVLEQMHQASQAFDDLIGQQRQLNFNAVAGGRVAIQLQDLAGNAIRSVSPSEALDVAAGRPLS